MLHNLTGANKTTNFLFNKVIKSILNIKLCSYLHLTHSPFDFNLSWEDPNYDLNLLVWILVYSLKEINHHMGLLTVQQLTRHAGRLHGGLRSNDHHFRRVYKRARMYISVHNTGGATFTTTRIIIFCCQNKPVCCWLSLHFITQLAIVLYRYNDVT